MLQGDVITSAGLHFMASVRKKAIECQDASTNTDPGKMVLYFFFKTDLQGILNYMIDTSYSSQVLIPNLGTHFTHFHLNIKF